MSHHEATAQRRRATHLRRLATTISTTPAVHLERHLGADTWFGPRAQDCTGRLAAARSDALAAVDDLRARARWIDAHADRLDAAAAAADLAATTGGSGGCR
ncbi:hypothetical protein [Ilumatobacter sp.]|uniref:hypothetical protein n=1 Tax=Ilumatobacter sp. TaxID=1967498 RepID=UPI003B528162